MVKVQSPSLTPAFNLNMEDAWNKVYNGTGEKHSGPRRLESACLLWAGWFIGAPWRVRWKCILWRGLVLLWVTLLVKELKSRHDCFIVCKSTEEDWVLLRGERHWLKSRHDAPHKESWPWKGAQDGSPPGRGSKSVLFCSLHKKVRKQNKVASWKAKVGFKTKNTFVCIFYRLRV